MVKFIGNGILLLNWKVKNYLPKINQFRMLNFLLLIQYKTIQMINYLKKWLKQFKKSYILK